MPQHENRFGNPAERVDDSALADDPEVARLSAARTRAMDEAGAAIAQQLNGPLTALLLYMGEIKQHSHFFALSAADNAYLQTIIQNAVLQTERVCPLVKQIAGDHEAKADASRGDVERRTARIGDVGLAQRAGLSKDAGHKALTRREREVLQLISEGYSNKKGALRMQISPRTFESHRAEAMRKLGARNTADLVRAALLHPLD
jgi:DNA-binding CsgD family transcriptional regulator